MSPTPPNFSASFAAPAELKGQAAMDFAATLLPPMPEGLPPQAQSEYARVYHAAAKVMGEEKDPNVRAQMGHYYGRYIGQYAQAIKTQPNNMAGYWQHFRDGMYPNAAMPGMLTLPQMEAQAGFKPGTPNSTPRVLFDKLADEMRGPNVLTSLVYDRERGRREDSTMSGIKWGGIAGGVAGFMAGGMLGVGGMMGWVVRIAMALGGAYGGGLLEKYIRGDKSEDERLAASVPTANFRPKTPEQGPGLGLERPAAMLPAEQLDAAAQAMRDSGVSAPAAVTGDPTAANLAKTRPAEKPGVAVAPQ